MTRVAGVIEAPASLEAPGSQAPAFSGPSVFLAGGITGCSDWQAGAVAALSDLPITVLNPRRANFPIGDPSEAPRQIAWEHKALRLADLILFWFPAESLCPIVLYELGAWSMHPKPISVGTHPDYKRRTDVVEQTRLARPEVRVVSSLAELLGQVRQRIRVLELTR